MSDDVLHKVAQNKNLLLVEFDYGSMGTFSNVGLGYLADNCPDLEVLLLNLGSYSSQQTMQLDVGVAGIKKVLHQCRRLRVLDLQGRSSAARTPTNITLQDAIHEFGPPMERRTSVRFDALPEPESPNLSLVRFRNGTNVRLGCIPLSHYVALVASLRVHA